MARRSMVHAGSEERAELLRRAVKNIEAELDVPREFPADVVADAQASADNPVLPQTDRTDIPLLTIDPLGARDLDQAMHLERDGTGYVVWYAIADVAAFVRPGSATDREAHRRGETLYALEHRVPLHPPVLSESAASLLPDEVRPALLWRIALDSAGRRTDTDVRRALVRSRAQLDYLAVQQALDSDGAGEVFGLLREIGMLRQDQERARGGVSLPTTDQEIDVDGDVWTLVHRAEAPVEGWNAQISLLTGMAAADLMLSAEVGVLRTLRMRTRATLRVCAGPRLRWGWSGRMPRRRPTSCVDSTPQCLSTRRWCRPQHGCSAAPRTSLSTGSCLSSRGTPLSRRSTHTSPRRFGAWPTGTQERCAWRCARGSRCPRGRSKCSPRCRRRCATPTAGRQPSTVPSWTPSKPGSSALGWVRS